MNVDGLTSGTFSQSSSCFIFSITILFAFSYNALNITAVKYRITKRTRFDLLSFVMERVLGFVSKDENSEPTERYLCSDRKTSYFPNGTSHNHQKDKIQH